MIRDGAEDSENLVRMNTGSKGWNLIMEDLAYQAFQFGICPAGNNRITGAKRCFFLDFLLLEKIPL